MRKILITIGFVVLLAPQLAYAATLREELDLLHKRVDTTNERIGSVENNVSGLPMLEAKFAGLETYAVNAVSNSLDSMKTFTIVAIAFMVGLLGLTVLLLAFVSYHKISQLMHKRIRESVEATVRKRLEAHTVENLKLPLGSEFSNKLHDFGVNTEENGDGEIAIVPSSNALRNENMSERQTTLSIFNLSEPLV